MNPLRRFRRSSGVTEPRSAALFTQLMLLFALCSSGTAAASDTAHVSIVTNTDSDTLVVGAQSNLIVKLDSDGDSLLEARFSFQWLYSNGNIVGPLTGPENPVFSPKALTAFDFWIGTFGNGSDPDTTFARLTEFDEPPLWSGAGEVFRYTFVASDTGTITIDPDFQGLTPEEYTGITRAPDFSEMAISFDVPVFTVVPCSLIVVTGDVNRASDITSADIIHLVNYVFKSGVSPRPIAEAGDINCTASIDAADIIYLINHVFKGGASPCDVCSML